jgi:hypothetical protein
LERLKQGKYNKPHWLRYIRRHQPPGPTEEDEEEEEEEEEGEEEDQFKIPAEQGV